MLKSQGYIERERGREGGRRVHRHTKQGWRVRTSAEQQTINFPCVGEHGRAKPQTGNSDKSKHVPAVKLEQMAKRM